MPQRHEQNALSIGRKNASHSNGLEKGVKHVEDEVCAEREGKKKSLAIRDKGIPAPKRKVRSQGGKQNRPGSKGEPSCSRSEGIKNDSTSLELAKRGEESEPTQYPLTAQKEEGKKGPAA